MTLAKSKLDARTIQRWLQNQNLYTGKIDGILGPKSEQGINRSFALTSWSTARKFVAIQQSILEGMGISPGKIDGYIGPDTLYAIEQWQNKMRDVVVPSIEIVHQPTVFPRYGDMRSFYGEPGKSLTRIELPYAMVLAWDTDVTIPSFMIHSKCADSAMKAFRRVADIYTPTQIKSLGLDLFGGCLNNRPMRGGTSLSTHAWAAAIDFDPSHNQFRWGADKARMDNPEYKPFLDAWTEEGWISLGRERNYDWMHLQAVRL